MNAGDVRITNARCANETAVVLHHHQRGRATDCCDDGTQPDDHVPPPRGNQQWLPARIIDCKPGCGRDLYPEREPSKWKVEITLKRRIDQATKYTSLEDLCISPQCGFASTYHGNIMTIDQEAAKLRLCVETALEVRGSL